MADFIPRDELNSILEDLKNTITSNLSDTKLSKFYNDLVDDFIKFCRNIRKARHYWGGFRLSLL
jgi:hypothetical protein